MHGLIFADSIFCFSVIAVSVLRQVLTYQKLDMLSLGRIYVRKKTQHVFMKRSSFLRALSNCAESNEDIKPAKTFINRNTRSLERFALAHKDQGWGRGRTKHELANVPKRSYYHRICLERTNAHTHAFLQHYSGKEVITASTTEWCIRKHLYSSTDVTASSKVGLILAERCIRAGISCAEWVNCTETSCESTDAFHEAVRSTGFSLCEPDQVRFRYTKPHHKVLGPAPRPIE